MSLRHMMLLVPFVWAQLAQAQVVQQPVVGVNNVTTAVSVPDLGSAVLGSVGRAASGRSDYGPLPFGTSTGREVSRSSTQMLVTIHDFDSMDQILLEAAQQRASHVPWRNPVARFAWQQAKTGNASLMGTLEKHYSAAPPLPQEDRTVVTSRTAPAVDVVPPEPVPEVVPMVPRRLTNSQADRLLDLGDRALLRNDRGSALGFYRGAANLGSKDAQARIDQILNERR